MIFFSLVQNPCYLPVPKADEGAPESTLPLCFSNNATLTKHWSPAAQSHTAPLPRLLVGRQKKVKDTLFSKSPHRTSRLRCLTWILPLPLLLGNFNNHSSSLTRQGGHKWKTEEPGYLQGMALMTPLEKKTEIHHFRH